MVCVVCAVIEHTTVECVGLRHPEANSLSFRPTVTRKANAWVAAVAKLPRADVVAHVGLCRIQTKVDVQHVTRTLTHAPGVHHEVVYRPRHRRQAPVVGIRVSADVVAKHVGAVAEDSIDVPLAPIQHSVARRPPIRLLFEHLGPIWGEYEAESLESLSDDE